VGPGATLALGGAAAAVASRMSLGMPRQIVGAIAVVAIFLTVWELLPMPGRDGGRILAQFLSPTARLKFENLAQYEALFVLGAFFLLQRTAFAVMTNPICAAFSAGSSEFPACPELLR
jgi:Zn-dependent protease